MKTTLNISDELLAEARKATGLQEKTAIVHAGLEALILRAKAKRLAALAGTERQIRAVARRRPRRKS